MANSSEMRLIITQLRHQLLQSPVFFAGRPDSPLKAQKEAARLEEIGDRLQIIIRDVNNSEALIRVRESGLRKLPHDQRWSTRQSLNQLGENLRALHDEAEALAKLVHDLLERNGVLNPIQKTKAVIDLMKDLEKVAGHDLQLEVAILREATSEASIGPVPHGASSSIGITGVISALAFAYLGSKILARKFGKGAN